MSLDILHVLPDLACGGAERLAVDLMCRTARSGAKVAALCTGSPRANGPEAQLAGAGVPVTFLGKPRGARPSYAWRVLRQVGRCAPRLVHTHRHALPYVVPTLLARGLPCVHTIHTPAGHEVSRAAALAHHVAFLAGAVPVAVSRAVARSFALRYQLEASVIPNGIDLAAAASGGARRAGLRAQFGCDERALVFVSVGRLSEEKDPAGLVEAFARGPAAHSRAALWLVGDGPLRAEVERTVAQAGLRGRVRLLGERADVPALLAAADAFVLASRREGLPLSLMEAMAAGLAVVATDAGGVPELVIHHRTGLLVPSGDRVALAGAMTRLVADEELRRRLAAAALDHARRHCDAAAMARSYGELYAELLGAGPARQAATT